MGEEALEKILTDSGLQEGANYYKQQHKTVDGVTVKPDIVVELANGGNLVIDLFPTMISEGLWKKKMLQNKKNITKDMQNRF